MTTPVSKFIGEGRHKLLIGEHPDKAYIASYVDDTIRGGFYTVDDLLEIEATVRCVRRRITLRQADCSTSKRTAT
jgi:hypothetical protein